jgi:hypothetical protein
MAEVKVLLMDWEHECCGETRQVGEQVTMSMFCNDGALVEQRHDYGNDFHGQPLTGRILAIEWQQLDDIGHVVRGSPAVPLTSTDGRPVGQSWAFEFTVATEDPIPGSR